jgi:16S rRNA (adenine1518-N6/adenine1519-N6)-dimethyltransferase
VAEVDLDHMFGLVRVAFGQRRKMLRRSLASKVTDAEFAAAVVDPAERPQDLSVDRWVALANATVRR